jgi:hypothetical protein
MRAAKVTEQVHSIGTQSEPNIVCLFSKLWECGVEILPLLAIRRVPQLAIAFRAIIRCMLGH